MASSVLNFLDFTYKFSQGEENPVPVLDSQLWVSFLAKEAKPWFADGNASNWSFQRGTGSRLPPGNSYAGIKIPAGISLLVK